MAAAKRKRDRETQTVAVLGLGNTLYRQGFYRRAREAHLAGLALARQDNLRMCRGRALGGLFVVSLDLRDARAAEAYAREAVAAYGAAHPNMPALAHDVAYFWLGRGHRCSGAPGAPGRPAAPAPSRPAPPGARRAPPAPRPEWGTAPRTRSSSARCGETARDPLAAGALAAALFEAAVGASLLHDRELAGELLDEVLHLARERGEADVLARAEGLRAGIPTAPVDEAQAPAGGQDANDFARELVSCLETGLAR